MKRDPRHLDDKILKQALDEVKAVYRDLALRPVERACERRTECCRFRLTGETPYLTRGEAWVAAKAWKASGRSKLVEKKREVVLSWKIRLENVIFMKDDRSDVVLIFAKPPEVLMLGKRFWI